MEIKKIEKIIKSVLKKRFKYTMSLLVLFLVSGNLYGITNKELYELIHKADFYSKNNGSSTQIFYSYYIDNEKGEGKERRKSDRKNILKGEDIVVKNVYPSTSKIKDGIDFKVASNGSIIVEKLEYKAPSLVKNDIKKEYGGMEYRELSMETPTVPTLYLPKVRDTEGFTGDLTSIYDYYGDSDSKKKELRTLLDQISIKDGKFRVESGKNIYALNYRGEAGITHKFKKGKGDAKDYTFPAKIDETLSNRGQYFMGITKSAYMNWDKNVEISWFGNGNQLIYADIVSGVTKGLDTLYKNSEIEKDKYETLKRYKDITGYNDMVGLTYYNNDGKISIFGTDSKYIAVTDRVTPVYGKLAIFSNNGEILGMNRGEISKNEKATNQVVFHSSPDVKSDTGKPVIRSIFTNGKDGKIKMYGDESIVMNFTSNQYKGAREKESEKEKHQKDIASFFINEGEISLYGANSFGIFVNEGEKLNIESGFRTEKPFELYGDGDTGLYIAGEIGNNHNKENLFKVEIGKDGNDKNGVDWEDIKDGKKYNIKGDGDTKGEVEYVNNAIGIMYNNESDGTLENVEIKLKNKSKDSLGIAVNKGKLSVKSGDIQIDNGVGDIAIFTEKGGIEYTGKVKIKKNNIVGDGVALYSDGGNIKYNGEIDIEGKNLQPFVIKNGGNIDAKDVKLNVDINDGKNLFVYADNGKADLSSTNIGNNNKIKIKSLKNEGVAIYGINNSDIKVQNSDIELENLKNGIILKDNSKADISGSKLNYKGEGLAIYVDKSSKLVYQNGIMELDGKSTGIYKDLKDGEQDNIDGKNTKIVVKSKDVIVSKLENIGEKDISDLKNLFDRTLGGMEIDNSKSVEGFKKLSLKNGTIVIDRDIDKGSKDKNSIDYLFSKETLLENTNIVLKDDIKLSGVVSQSDLTGEFIGLKNDTKGDIELKNGSIIDIRKVDGENGATAVYLNDGKVNLDKGSKIVVGKGTTNQNVGIFVKTDGKIKNDGRIVVDGKKSIGVLAEKGNINLENRGIIETLGDNNIAVYMNNGKFNNLGELIIGKNSIGGYFGENVNIGNIGKIKFVGESIGIIAKNSTILNGKDMVLEGQNGSKNNIGVYLEGDNDINLNVDMRNIKNSVGIYSKGGDLNFYGDIKLGDGDIGLYSINGDISLDKQNIDFSGKNGIAILMKNGNLDLNKDVIVKNENKNGNKYIYSEGGNISINKKFIVDGISNDKSLNKTIGIYIDQKNSQDLNIKGDIIVKNGGIFTYGIGDKISLKLNGELDVENNGIGFYMSKGGYISGDSLTINSVDNEMGIGVYYDEFIGRNDINLTLKGKNSIGIYTGKDTVLENSRDIKTISGENNIGVYIDEASKYISKGDIDLSGKRDVGGIVSDGSFINDGDISIENESIGLVSRAEEGKKGYLENNGKIDVKGDIGLYLGGKGENIGKNNGEIDVKKGVGVVIKGGEYYENGKLSLDNETVGIFIKNGTIYNNGRIELKTGKGVAIYGKEDRTQIINNGEIQLDNGLGVVVKNGAKFINNKNGVIKITGKDENSIGVIGYNGGTIYNDGMIDIEKGVGVYVDDKSKLENNGIIRIGDGIGIQGKGEIINKGVIDITGKGISVDKNSAIQIDEMGRINISTKYKTIGGTLITESPIHIDGGYVDISSTLTSFVSPSVSGKISLLPEFVTTGDGLKWEVKDFIKAKDIDLDIKISPLYKAKLVNNGDLIVEKIPYEALNYDNIPKELEKGLDNIMRNGNSNDKDILKRVNKMLSSISADNFEQESEKAFANIKGDIYGTLDKRIKTVGRSFDRAFDEMESSYNFTRKTDKFSVIQNRGKYSDDNIVNYRYNTIGLLYMREYDKNKLDSKYGYTFGFANSEFNFSDTDSKESIFSVRAGLHNSEKISEKYGLSLLTKLDLQYNRHINKRDIILDKRYRDNARFNSYQVRVGNRLNKELVKDFDKKLNLYGDVGVSYNYIDGFEERGDALRLKGAKKNYASGDISVGIKGEKRVYIGNRWSTKFSVDGGYKYTINEKDLKTEIKLKDGDSKYYKLNAPREERGKFIGKVGLTFERANEMGVTFEVGGEDIVSKDRKGVNYGVRFNYKFNN